MGIVIEKNSPIMKPYVALDLEATSPNPEEAEILEIAAQDAEGRTFHRYVATSKPLKADHNVFRFTGIPFEEYEREKVPLEGALREVLRLLEGSHKVALVNKVEELTDALEAAYRLYKGHKPRHPEFSLFRSWEHLKFLIERFPSIAAQYRPYERLVEEYTDRIPDICRTLRHSLVSEEEAEVVVSTAHRSKGREWDGVVLAEDFEGVTLAQENAAHGCVALYPEEANLTYVAFTRARNALNKGSFSAVLEYQKHLATAVRKGAKRLCTEENLKPKAPEPQPPKAEEAPQRGVRTLWKKLFGD